MFGGATSGSHGVGAILRTTARSIGRAAIRSLADNPGVDRAAVPLTNQLIQVAQREGTAIRGTASAAASAARSVRRGNAAETASAVEHLFTGIRDSIDGVSAARAALRDHPSEAAQLGLRGGPPIAGRDLETLRTMDPTAFEQTVAQALHRSGYSEVRRVGGAGDLGVDVFGISPDGLRTIVQCKRYGENTTVGSAEMQMFLGAMTIHQADRGMYVTTSRYTSAASDLGNRFGIELYDATSIGALLG